MVVIANGRTSIRRAGVLEGQNDTCSAAPCKNTSLFSSMSWCQPTNSIGTAVCWLLRFGPLYVACAVTNLSFDDPEKKRMPVAKDLICFVQRRSLAPAKIRHLRNSIFYMQMVYYSGADALFWWFKFNGEFVRWIFILNLRWDNPLSFWLVRSHFFFFKQKYVHL